MTLKSLFNLKDLKEKNDSSINIQYGSYNTKSLSISTGYQIEGTKLGLRFSNTESDGYSALETSKEGAENDGYFNREISIKMILVLAIQAIANMCIFSVLLKIVFCFVVNSYAYKGYFLT